MGWAIWVARDRGVAILAGDQLTHNGTTSICDATPDLRRRPFDLPCPCDIAPPNPDQTRDDLTLIMRGRGASEREYEERFDFNSVLLG